MAWVQEMPYQHITALLCEMLVRLPSAHRDAIVQLAAKRWVVRGLGDEQDGRLYRWAVRWAVCDGLLVHTDGLFVMDTAAHRWAVCGCACTTKMSPHKHK
jgi:hypothetical protein